MDTFILSASSQSMVAIVAVRPNVNGNLFSGEWNDARLDHVNEKRVLGRSKLF
jgi:hypothetical protein